MPELQSGSAIPAEKEDNLQLNQASIKELSCECTEIVVGGTNDMLQHAGVNTCDYLKGITWWKKP